MIRCLIFDLDGTLVDTLEDLATITNEIFHEYNYPNIEFNEYKFFIGNGIKKLLERAINFVNGDILLLDIFYEKFISEYQKNFLRYAKLYPNIFELITYLKSNNYLLFVNTNKNDFIAKEIIKNLLPNTFINIYGESLNYPKKPDPYIINKIIKEYKLNLNEVIYVGDSNVDVFTAHNANIKAIGCCYGFRGKKELENAKADFLIDDPLEIIKIINN